jgi:hypothetical protein
LAFPFYGCEEVDIDSLSGEDKKTDQKLFLDEATREYTGLDLDGNERTCTDKYFDQICTMEFTSSDAYGLNCEREGNLAVSCGCHDWICVIPEESNDETSNIEFGLDINGEESSCTPMSETAPIACTQVFTEQDQFALDCRDNGDKVIKCGCHSYLCSKE